MPEFGVLEATSWGTLGTARGCEKNLAKPPARHHKRGLIIAMPTYEYLCLKCGKTLEVFQPMKDAPLKTCTCPEKGKVKRLPGRGAGIIFKGSGFYENDYRRHPVKPGGAKTDGGGAAKSDGAPAPPASAPPPKP